MELLAQRYRIVETLSEGGFGETWLAEDTHLPSRRRCVIKRLKPLSEAPQTYELIAGRFQREAAIQEDLGEGNSQIPRLYAHFESEGQFYLVQEWVQGHTLTQQVEQRGPQSESAVCALLVALLPVLNYIHSRQIVHRDIKPDNIILRASDGLPVLLDFGAVKETMGAEITASGSSTCSVMMGTPGYMPPEQAAGRPVYASDLYALGLTAIYALTGQPPQTFAADPSTGAIQWRSQAPQLGPTLAAVLDAAVQLNTQQRHDSAQAMLAALQPAGKTGASSPVSPSQPTQVSAAPVASQQSTAKASSGGLKEWQKAILTGSVMGLFVVGAFSLTDAETSPFRQASTQSNNTESNGAEGNATEGDPASGNATQQASSEASPKVPSTQPSPSTSESNSPQLSRQKAAELIEGWLQAKQRIFAPPFDRQLLAQLTTGERYRGNNSTIEWLQSNNGYYEYGVQKVESIRRFIQNGNNATVKFDYTEDRTLYFDGEIVPEETDFETRTAVYDLRFEEGQWKIASAKIEATSAPQQAASNYQIDSNTRSGLNQEKAYKIIKRWMEAKKEIFAPPYNRELAVRLTTDGRYDKLLKSGGIIDRLEANNSYYMFGTQNINDIQEVVVNGNKAKVWIDYTEERRFYRDGEIVPGKTQSSTKDLIYNLRFEENRWKIASYRADGANRE